MTLSQSNTSSTNTPKATCVSPQEHSGSDKNDIYQSMVWSNTPHGKEPDWSLYDAIEIHPLVNLNDEGEETMLATTDDDDPDICCWCVYGHLKVPGGIEDLHDVDTLEEAEQLALYCRTKIDAHTHSELKEPDTTLSDFLFTTECKAPHNTLGVYGLFYFGSIDGVEVGSPCDSADESLQQAKTLLNQTEPYTLVELLTDWIEWGDMILPRLKESQQSTLRQGLTKQRALLEKIKRYQQC